MLTKLDYYKLVLVGLESLEREIKDCREFTVSEYNNIVRAEEAAKQQQTVQPAPQPAAQPKVTKVEKPKETK